MILTTIGFTQTTAEGFFGRLERAGVRRVVDVRLHTSSQLAGFAKAQDLAYFLKRIGGIDYRHAALLAPTDEVLKAYRQKQISWAEYQRRFLDLIAERRIERQFDPAEFADACLLCSEAKPHHCHRRLVAEYLREHWPVELTVAHL